MGFVSATAVCCSMDPIVAKSRVVWLRVKSGILFWSWRWEERISMKGACAIVCFSRPFDLTCIPLVAGGEGSPSRSFAQAASASVFRTTPGRSFGNSRIDDENIPLFKLNCCGSEALFFWKNKIGYGSEVVACVLDAVITSHLLLPVYIDIASPLRLHDSLNSLDLSQSLIIYEPCHFSNIHHHVRSIKHSPGRLRSLAYQRIPAKRTTPPTITGFLLFGMGRGGSRSLNRPGTKDFPFKGVQMCFLDGQMLTGPRSTECQYYQHYGSPRKENGNAPMSFSRL